MAADIRLGVPVSDVFLSNTSGDRDRAGLLAENLKEYRHWDLPGLRRRAADQPGWGVPVDAAWLANPRYRISHLQ